MPVCLLLAAALATQLAGGPQIYVVVAGDSLWSVAAVTGVDAQTIARENGLPASARLRAGQTLHVDALHIVPPVLERGIIVNVPQRMLFLIEDGRAVLAGPVAAGRPAIEWQTPLGPFAIRAKDEAPTWHVPESIQREMAREGHRVIVEMPPGPDNPLGAHRMSLTMGSVAIHGTNAPASIYQLRTHGCVRLQPPTAADLFSRVEVGTPGVIIYEPILLGRTADGRIYLEAHRDAYGRISEPPRVRLLRLAREAGLDTAIDWSRAWEILARLDGVARDITRRIRATSSGRFCTKTNSRSDDLARRPRRSRRECAERSDGRRAVSGGRRETVPTWSAASRCTSSGCRRAAAHRPAAS